MIKPEYRQKYCLVDIIIIIIIIVACHNYIECTIPHCHFTCPLLLHK